MAERTGAAPIEEAVTDKGYHSVDVLSRLYDQGVRSYIAEPDRGRQYWSERRAEQAQVYANRRRIRGSRGRRLHRQRAEHAERSNAHMYETGGMRHLYLRGRANIKKRLLIHGAAYNLGLVLRKCFGLGKPRSHQSALSRLVELLSGAWGRCRDSLRPVHAARAAKPAHSAPAYVLMPLPVQAC